jgi:hypothetical protein
MNCLPLVERQTIRGPRAVFRLLRQEENAKSRDSPDTVASSLDYNGTIADADVRVDPCQSEGE